MKGFEQPRERWRESVRVLPEEAESGLHRHLGVKAIEFGDSSGIKLKRGKHQDRHPGLWLVECGGWGGGGQLVCSLLLFFFFHLKSCSSEPFPPNIPMPASLCHSRFHRLLCTWPEGSRWESSLLPFPRESCSHAIKHMMSAQLRNTS